MPNYNIDLRRQCYKHSKSCFSYKASTFYRRTSNFIFQNMGLKPFIKLTLGVNVINILKQVFWKKLLHFMDKLQKLQFTKCTSFFQKTGFTAIDSWHQCYKYSETFFVKKS